MTLSIAQSPSVEDLLSARSKRSHQNLATNSIYSTITTLSAKTELDLSESARLAMAQESADPVWSPSMSSNYDHDDTRREDCDGDDNDDDDDSSTQNEHVSKSRHHLFDQSPNPDFATPTLSESEYSRSPSLGSVRMAAVVQKAIPTSGLGISSVSGNTNGQDRSEPSSSSSSIDNNEYTPTASPSKRVMNARNLIINTSGFSAARPYPNQTTTPPIAMPNSARIEHSPPPLTSRSVPETSSSGSNSNYNKINTSSSPLRTATLPPVPHTALPVQRSYSQTKSVRRSSTDSSLSYLSSPLIDDDDTLGPHKASLLRMQSFLGPKMKHISPAPWSTDADASSVVSTSSAPVSESASVIWSEVDSEIGSVHMATKSTTRNTKSGNGKDGITSTATGTLKGLGLAIASASAVVANATTGGGSGGSRPSTSSERSGKSRTTTASSAFSSWSGTSRGTTNDGGRITNGISRSQSQEQFDASSIPLPPLPSPSAAIAASVKVTNITRSKSPEENYPPLPSSAATPKFPPLSRSVSPADKLESEPGSEAPFSQLKTVTSAPEGNGAPSNFTAASACIHALSTSLPENSIQKNNRKPPSLPRKRPPMVHQDSNYSSTTSACTSDTYTTGMSHSTSQTSLPAPNSDPSDLASKANSPNGMKLISLQDARERERERGTLAAERRAEQLQQMQQAQQQQQQQQQANAQRARQAQAQAITTSQPPPQPTGAPPPPPPTKTLKSKKSGFLKLFKHKEDQSQAPAVPRPSTDSLPSPKMSQHGFHPNTRNVSAPTDPRKIDGVLHIGSTSPTMPTSGSRTPARSDFASAVPFPHRAAPTAPADGQSGANAEVRKAGSSAPPQVSLIKPSPDLGKTQGAFQDSRGALSVQDHGPATGALQANQAALAPSLSLRPVSMMLSSMPPNFLAEMEKSVKKSAHLQAIQTPGGSSISSFDSLGGRASPARTPDTPSFVFFDSDNNATPPSGQTPNTPATEQFNGSPSPTNSSKSHNSNNNKPVFGLPTPPHSASSSRTFSASNLPPPPTSPSTPSDQAREMALSAAYRAKIVELEQLVIGLRAELAAATGEPIQITLSDADGKDTTTTKKACGSCGCCCRSSNNSVLSRPRVVGHGNMFSSGRG